MKKSFHHLSIAKKLVLAMILSSTLITIVTTYIQLHGVYLEDLSSIEKRLEEINDVHVPDLSERLWISDEKNIQGHLDGLIKFDGIHAAFVYDNDRLLSQAGKELIPSLTKELFPLKYSYKNENLDIGRLEVFVTLDHVYDHIISQIVDTLIGNGIKTFLVGLFILLFFNFLLTRHLTSLSRYFHNFDINSSNSDLELERPSYKGRNDELDIVVNAVNHMQRNITGSVIEIDNKNKALALDKKRNELLIELMERPFNSEQELIHYALASAIKLSGSHSGSISISAQNHTPSATYSIGSEIHFGDECSTEGDSGCANCLQHGNTVIDNEQPDSSSPTTKSSVQRKMCCPITIKKNIVGVATVANKPEPYTDDDATQLNLYIHSLWNLVLRKRAQADLDESEQHYKSLLETSLAIPWKMNVAAQRMSFIGHQIVEILGYSIEELSQDHFWRDHIHPDDIDEINQKYREVLSSGEGYSTKYRINSKEGKEHWFLEHANIITTKDNKSELQGFMFDITEQEQQDLVLRRTQKMDAMDTLTGGIVHDYNNMLGVIIGYSELMAAQVSEDPKLTKYSNQIRQAAKRGANLTSKLLQFSKQHTTSISTISLNELLSDDEDMLAKTITPGIKLKLELGDKLNLVHIDKNGMEDALLNMCINAMHAMPSGGTLILRTKNITLTKLEHAHYQLDAGDYVQLSIIDSGIGMDAGTQEKVFDPFFSTKGEGGTGLGLSQVYGFVKSSDGTIHIESKPGQGTNISILLPTYKLDPDSVPTEESADSKLLNGDEKILVVDDETVLGEMAEEILSDYGYTVDVATSGAAALQKLSETHFDMVISDVIMPEMSGYQLAHEIRRLYPEIKIQLNSGFNDDCDRTEEDALLYENIIHKPYSSKILLTQVRKMFDSQPY